MYKVKITDDYRSLISRSPNIMAVHFVGTHPVEVISRDTRFSDVEQVLLTREQILGDFEKRKINNHGTIQ
jgi:hypothetical protein